MEIMITFEMQGYVLQSSLTESEWHVGKTFTMQYVVYVLDTFKEYFTFYSWKC